MLRQSRRSKICKAYLRLLDIIRSERSAVHECFCLFTPSASRNMSRELCIAEAPELLVDVLFCVEDIGLDENAERLDTHVTGALLVQ